MNTGSSALMNEVGSRVEVTMYFAVLCVLLSIVSELQARPQHEADTKMQRFEQRETLRVDFSEESEELIKAADMLAALLQDPDSARFRVLHNKVASVRHLKQQALAPIDTDYNLFAFEKSRTTTQKAHVEQAAVVETTERVFYILPAKPAVQAEDYDYHALCNELYHEEEPENATFTVPLDELLGETMAEIVDIRPPRNCSVEERRGIGLQAIECLWTDLRSMGSKDQRRRAALLLVQLLALWLALILGVALVVWCHTGRIFCFRLPCRCVNPRRMHDEVRIYLTTHEPGVLDVGDGATYKPSEEEVDSFYRLQSALQDF